MTLTGLLCLVSVLFGSPVWADSMESSAALSEQAGLLSQGEVPLQATARLLSVHALRGDEYRVARDALVYGPALAEDELVVLAEHPDWRVRETAAIVLGWRNQPSLFQAIQDVRPVQARSGRQDLRHEAFAQTEARPAVVERLLHGSDSPAVRSGLVVHLVGKGDDWGRLAVHILAEELSGEVRVALVWALRHAAGEAAMDGAHLGLMDSDAGVRAQACRTIGFHEGGAVLVPELLGLLDDDDGRVRGDAARALGWLRAEAATDALVPGLSDSVPEVRLHSLRAISRLDPSGNSLLPWLGALVDDQDPRVARLARRLSSE